MRQFNSFQFTMQFKNILVVKSQDYVRPSLVSRSGIVSLQQSQATLCQKMKIFQKVSRRLVSYLGLMTLMYRWWLRPFVIKAATFSSDGIK